MNEKLAAVAFAAHPDDIELTCAGTMIKLSRMGYRTGIISLSAGEMGTRGNPETRKREFKNACGLMGLTMCRIMDIPDGHIEVNKANKNKVISELRSWMPDIVFAPYWKTRHPDHANCSHLVRESAFLSGLKNIDTGQSPFRPARVIYYMELYDFIPSFIVDVSDTFEEKMKAIHSYESQFNNEKGGDEGATYIGTPEFLQSIETRSRYWGNKIGVPFGEPFLVREPIKMDDPVDHFTSYHFAGLL
jgi:bacillithiol biosynthesis deacetylase BshB1